MCTEADIPKNNGTIYHYSGLLEERHLFIPCQGRCYDADFLSLPVVTGTDLISGKPVPPGSKIVVISDAGSVVAGQIAHYEIQVMASDVSRIQRVRPGRLAVGRERN